MYIYLTKTSQQKQVGATYDFFMLVSTLLSGDRQINNEATPI